MAVSAFERVNLASSKVKNFLLLLSILLALYIVGFYGFVKIRMIGESNPETWKSISELLNGMSFQFSLEKAGPMLNNSVQLFIASLILLVGFFMLRWQILRTTILGIALLSLAYLICAVLLLIIQSSFAHVVALTALAVLFIWGFLVQSNLLIYWYDREYTDIAIELFIALGFLFFIGRMLFMALGG